MISRWLVPLLFAAALSGCNSFFFKSERPLVSAADSSFPFAAASLNDDGALFRKEDYYVFGDGTGGGIPLRLFRVTNQYYVGQLGVHAPGKAPYHYVFLNIDINGKKIDVYTLAPKKTDVGPGLRDCSGETAKEVVICVDILAEFVRLSESAIAAGATPEIEFQILAIRSVPGTLNEALAAYHRGDYGASLLVIRPLADNGNAEARVILGVMYYSGTGVPQNDEKAATLYRAAADQGSAQAQNNLGQMYEKGRGMAVNNCEAAKWYRLSADQGNELAQANQRALLNAAPAAPSCVNGLQLSDPNRWVQVASRRDLNDAVAVALEFAAQKSRVVASQNGWFAVVVGPHSATDMQSFRKTYTGPKLPDDASLVRGSAYVETMWPRVTTPADWATCAEVGNSDAGIGACTIIINAGTEPELNVAIAHANRGAAYLDKGNVDRAMVDLDNSIRLLRLGYALRKEGQLNLAIAYGNRGLAYAKRGDPVRALINFRYEAAADLDRAIEDYNQAIQLNPDYAEAFSNRGLAYANKGDPAKALFDLATAAALIPASDPAQAKVLAIIAEVEKKVTTPQLDPTDFNARQTK